MICPYCGSPKIRNKGFLTLASGIKKQRHSCKECGKWFVNHNVVDSKRRFSPNKTLNHHTYVISSVQNNVGTHHYFLESLKLYCKTKDAHLILVPTTHLKTKFDTLEWDVDPSYLLSERTSLHGMVDILADMPIDASIDNPLGGLDPLSKGKSLIVPHNQLQMRSLPVQEDGHSVILHTTGTISHPYYSQTKSGGKAEFNHSYSAIVIEFDLKNSIYHIRVLNADERGTFYDIGDYYDGYEDEVSHCKHVEALVTGDEHVFVISEDVADATYHNSDSIVNVLRPNIIVRHDVLDAFTVSHHHNKDPLLQYSKFYLGKNKIEDELSDTFAFVVKTTPSYAKSVMVASNHHDHLKRWLNECNPKNEPWNAKIYHLLMLTMIQAIEDQDKIGTPDPLKLYFQYAMGTLNSNARRDVEFIGRKKPFKIKGIELSNHGDIGQNGSRGSLAQYSKFSDKVIIGHSHSPGINKGAYAVGCSTPKNLEYTNGPSSWMNTHCIIYPNGKRQLINIIKGRWRRT